MSSPNYITLFNNHFVEFLTDVENVFPEDVDIKTAKTSVLFLQKNNPSLLIKVWKKHVMDKYQHEIEKGNIQFFIEKDYNKDIEKTNNSEHINQIIERLRDPIASMSEDNKSKTIKYIQNLSKLANLNFSK